MRFRSPTSPNSWRSDADESHVAPPKTISHPVLNRGDSKISDVDGGGSVCERPQSRGGLGFLRRKLSTPSLRTSSDGGDEPVPPMPPLDFLRKKKSMPRMGSGDAGESLPPMPPPALIEKLRSRPTFANGEGATEHSSPKLSNPRNNRRPSPIEPSPASVLLPRVEPKEQTLSAEQIRDIYVGAPCFAVTDFKEKYTPYISFQGGIAESLAEASIDYKPFAHPSFVLSTLCRNASRKQLEDSSLDGEGDRWSKLLADVTEMPSMLCAEGLDPGAVSFEHFLQIQIADSLVEAADTDFTATRGLLKSNPDKLGLRRPDIEVLLPRLQKLAQLHSTNEALASTDLTETWSSAAVDGMGKELFETILTTDMAKDATGFENLSMKTQIRALQRMLKISALWYDFSLVKSRMRLGQLLWDSSYNRAHEEQVNERDVLLLQITLAAELSIRMHGVRAMAETDALLVPEREMNVLHSLRTAKIAWDLVLAERFLESISLSAKHTKELSDTDRRTSLFYAIPFLATKESSIEQPQYVQPQLTPKHGQRQLEGLLHFAEVLQWPHAQSLPRRFRFSSQVSESQSRISAVTSNYETPLSSPAQLETNKSRSGSFTFDSEQERPPPDRQTSAPSVRLHSIRRSGAYAGFDACGWLSKSWLSGLVLPGESAGGLLMSTLLEHSPEAIDRLGEEATLHDGFTYQGRSYWSKSCIVGRVMAARAGAAECMGWISIPEVGNGEPDARVAVKVKDTPTSRVQARIRDAESVAKDSDLLHGKGHARIARSEDFTWPRDAPMTTRSKITCQGLSFRTTYADLDRSGQSTGRGKSIAIVTFASIIVRKVAHVDIPLIYDVRFVSSCPCHPRVEQSANKATPLSPTVSSSPVDSGHASKQSSASTINLNTTEKRESVPASVHALHIDYHYDVVPMNTLFAAASETSPRAQSTSAGRRTETSAAAKEVLVLDCRGSDDLEVFARAWCAKVGEDAVIGKSGRTCLACCVREARALGICVVIRT